MSSHELYRDMKAGMFEKKGKSNANPNEDLPVRPLYLCNEKVKNCISAMMGTGGETIAEISIHDYFADFGVPKSFPPAENW